MRSVLSISIPPKKLIALRERAAIEGMTISAYVLRRIDEEEELISEDQLLKDIAENHKEIARGNYRMMGPNDKIEDFLPLD
jgi:hypothetical protein